MSHTFSTRLRYLLQKRSMSITQLSRLSGYSRQSIYKWLDDDFVSRQGLEVLSTVFNVTTDWLQYGDRTSQQTVTDKQRKLSPFFVVAENKEFKQAKAHMHAMDILVGSYHFADAKINYFNEVEDKARKHLPEDSIQLAKFIDRTPYKRLEVNFLKVLKTQKPRVFSLTPFKNNKTYCCTFLPILATQSEAVGLSFSIQSMMTPEQELQQFMAKKCQSCTGKMKMPKY